MGYNDFMKDVITKWKYRGDYELGNMFADVFRDAFEKQYSNLKKDCLIVPVPLSSQRLKERAFNQAEMLARLLPVEPVLAVERLSGEKQSKKSRRERILSKNPFIVTEPINKPVILVDDIYTTGTTLRHIARQLKTNGCPSVYGLTLARG
ncbi:ComF family protein [Lentibacillus sp. JNUCC-1]|uniref:ComF family protein n=1 Tax=Lentibacillus sp. JNUCC-1 TaxID=2654513 RepID=UPI001E494112|nr:ComF family protein [Lentibacillus sp. JNUCC-1]